MSNLRSAPSMLPFALLSWLVGCHPSGSSRSPGSTAVPGDETPAEASAVPATGGLARAVVDAPDRDADDRNTDARRKPVEFLEFCGVEPGMRVADLGAGSGYTTELLARAAGEEGVVFGQNNAVVIERFVKESWPARLTKPVMSKVVRVDREFDAPLPPEATDLDLVTMLFAYHDIIAFGGDPTPTNAAVFAALRPGGAFVIADHSAKQGSGSADTAELHRIDVQLVIEQVRAAGFELAEQGDFLRDPADTLDWKVWERGFATDRFVLRFVKPQGI